MKYLMDYQHYQKYNCPGVYCIYISWKDQQGKDKMKIVYVGQSKNMYTRICQHVREITKDLPMERKYQLLHNAWLKTQNPKEGDTHDVREIGFDVLERCEECDLKAIEQEWIDYYKPHLNTVGMKDNKTIDDRIKFDDEIFWLLELGNGWFNFED